MGGQVAKIRANHHRLLLDCRSQDRIVQSESFALAWELASKTQKIIALSYLTTISPTSLKFWVSDVLSLGALDQLNMLILRQIASYNRVKNYSRMSKQELINSIEAKGVKFDTTNRLRIVTKSSRRDAFNFNSLRDTPATNQHS